MPLILIPNFFRKIKVTSYFKLKNNSVLCLVLIIEKCINYTYVNRLTT